MKKNFQIAPKKENNSPAFRLDPVIHPMILDFLNDPAQIFSLCDSYGSPLNIMFPEIVEENISAFQAIYLKNNLQGQIFYTSKPNKSAAIIRQAALGAVSIDVSSEEGIKRAVSCGFTPARIEATGPKNLEYLTLAVQLGVIINADSQAEIDQIIKIRRALGVVEKTRLFVRLSGFHSPRVQFTSQDGTFGIHIDEAPAAISFLSRHRADFDFFGFSYHWSMATEEQRIVALENTLDLTFVAMRAGLQPRGIDIGGSFRIRYAADRRQWLGYVDQIKESLTGKAQRLTWNDGGLGFRYEGGAIKGAANFMDHAVERAGPDDLDDLLNHALPHFNGMTAAQVLCENLLNLYIEPGRAMLDQTGITIGRVNFTKKSVQGETLVGLDMNRSHMHSTHQKLLTDPVILYRDRSKNEKCPEGVFYMGNLCVSYDMIQYNKTFPEYLPREGDLVAFINTAPYIMDFIESRTLLQNTAEKVAVIRQGQKFISVPDEKYNPAVNKVK